MKFIIKILMLFMCVSYSCSAFAYNFAEKKDSVITKPTDYGTTYRFDFEEANNNIKKLNKKIDDQKKKVSNEKKVLNKLQKQLSEQQKEIKNAKKLIKKANSVIFNM